MTYLSNTAIRRLQEAVDLPDLVGTRYALVRHIARGGMGTIYLVEDKSLHRYVAMKVLDTVIESDELSARLRREAEIIAKLEHPGIVPIHDVGNLPDGRLYYTMKYVQGQQLDRTSLTSIAERLRVFQKVCDTVAFAHAKQIIHRDLKPQNIMVGSFGEVLVMDWGVAKSLNDGERTSTVVSESLPAGVSTIHGTVIGTPVYMSPEQRQGETATLDERSDIYSLGAILHFLLMGRPPDPDPQPPSFRKINPRIAKSIEAVCKKALSPNRTLRYSSVIALAADIACFLDGQPVSAYKENLFEMADRWITRNRFLVLLVLAYLFMRIVLLIVTGH